MLHILQDEVSLDTLVSQEFPVIVLYFTATWCGPCKMIWPKVQELSNVYKDSILFVKIDVDEFEDLCTDCEVSSMPTFQFFKRNKKTMFDILNGADQEELIKKCESAINN